MYAVTELNTVYDTSSQRTHQLRLLGLITGWMVDRLEQLMSQASHQFKLAAAEMPETAPASNHLAKAQAAEKEMTQFMDYIRPYRYHEPIQAHMLPIQMQCWETIGLLVAYVFADIQQATVSLTNQVLIALAKMRSEERAYAYLRSALDLLDDVATLVQNVLIFADEKALTRKAVGGSENLLDITSPIQETVDLLTAIRPPNVTLESRVASHLPLVTANSGQLRLVTMELLINGIEAALSNGSEVEISTGIEKVPGNNPFVGALRPLPGDYVCLTVSDHGAGLENEQMACMLLPQYSTKAGRSGSGLAIVSDIMHASGGAIQLHSQPGRGTIVKLYFPTYKPMGNGMFQKKKINTIEADYSGMTALIVENNDPLRESLSFVLASTGFSVLTAENGREGFTIFKQNQHQIDLVLLDLNLPGLPGAELFQLIREINPAQNIIISTALNKAGVARIIDKLGIVTLLRKPYEVHTLMQQINTAFRPQRNG